ncbi:hypothetical protein ACHAW5_005112 [Stephanodiscus triporus]|uniref:DUF6824 domain-containing protein n=1 Tax=Stephanodiscus triporus TaxID=2934178 RepID=A0ABD3MJE6_9STRA
MRLPGNEMYRKLVCMNKRVYAKCHAYDKRKVSKGIVDAIREFGGRFLEECEQKSKTYRDIGDKEALIKTEAKLCAKNVKTIRMQINSDLVEGRPQTELEAELLGSFNAPTSRDSLRLSIFMVSISILGDHYIASPSSTFATPAIIPFMMQSVAAFTASLGTRVPR